MNLQSISNSINSSAFFNFDEIKLLPKEKLFYDSNPILDRFFLSSSIFSLLFVSLPAPIRIVSNAISSVFFRGLDFAINKKSFNDFFNINLICNIGASILIGEIESVFYKIGIQSRKYTPRMLPDIQNYLRLKSSSFDNKTRMIEEAYYSRGSLNSLMLALRDPENFDLQHKNLIMNELRAVLLVFHPERAQSLSSYLFRIRSLENVGEIYHNCYSSERYSKVVNILNLNYKTLFSIKDTPDFVEAIKTLILLA